RGLGRGGPAGAPAGPFPHAPPARAELPEPGRRARLCRSSRPRRSCFRQGHADGAPGRGDGPGARAARRSPAALAGPLAFLLVAGVPHQLLAGRRGHRRRGLGISPFEIETPRRRHMNAYVLIETAAGKTKQVKKTLSKVKSVRASVSAMDAVTGPYDFIAVVEGQTLDAIGSLVTDSIGIIDGVTRTTTCVAVTV